ncbi:sulfiredoxin, chloroplastic/mitochondrial-like isoform X2 [Phragmites australis]|uniref:sulfiredoxin, chloroplastic/mitochondrial-like isoform X2 n=1 Tax=Phragmites australis TaxID=29695 RepID=UPI002D7950CC|nr:sulfiredoxin, chloroplastic/mitochondrial-like isoform X2 [Phragmites australis]
MASSSSLSLAKTMASGILLHRRAVPNASFLRGTGRIADAGRSKNHGFSASSSNAVPSLTSDSEKKGPVIMEIPLDKIRRPLMRTRANDPAKVQELMDSIRVIGLQVPVGIYIILIYFFNIQIDVLEVDGVYYGFSGCHRYEAHQRLGLPTIRCKVRRGTKETLRHHMR